MSHLILDEWIKMKDRHYKKFLRSNTSDSRIEQKKFNGMIKIPPIGVLVINSLIQHLYKSFVSYLLKISLFGDLLRAKYGGLVIIYFCLYNGGLFNVS